MTFQQDMEKKCEGTFSHSATSIRSGRTAKMPALVEEWEVGQARRAKSSRGRDYMAAVLPASKYTNGHSRCLTYNPWTW
jgi:hypothetical protein